MKGVTYDAGALIAAERGDREMLALHAACLDEGIIPTVPAPVIAQVWRGGARQALLSRLLSPCRVEAMGEAQALRVGELAATSGVQDVVDLAVVEGALRRGDVVVSSDPDDLAAVAADAGTRLSVLRI